MGETITNVFELVMLSLYAIARVAGTVAIVYLIVTKLDYDLGTFLLIVLTLIIGLGFSVKYHNPYDKTCAQQEHAAENSKNIDKESRLKTPYGKNGGKNQKSL